LPSRRARSPGALHLCLPLRSSAVLCASAFRIRSFNAEMRRAQRFAEAKYSDKMSAFR
jgi:hypothetical protein